MEVDITTIVVVIGGLLVTWLGASKVPWQRALAALLRGLLPQGVKEKITPASEVRVNVGLPQMLAGVELAGDAAEAFLTLHLCALDEELHGLISEAEREYWSKWAKARVTESEVEEGGVG